MDALFKHPRAVRRGGQCSAFTETLTQTHCFDSCSFVQTAMAPQLCDCTQCATLCQVLYSNYLNNFNGLLKKYSIYCSQFKLGEMNNFSEITDLKMSRRLVSTPGHKIAEPGYDTLSSLNTESEDGAEIWQCFHKKRVFPEHQLGVDSSLKNENGWSQDSLAFSDQPAIWAEAYRSEVGSSSQRGQVNMRTTS